jgi:hypothetical protein
MKTSSFLAELRRHSNLPAVFRAGGSAIAPHYHLTEVKRVNYETMDCGALAHRWSETQLELFEPSTAEAGRTHMPARKFLQIIDRVERDLPLRPDAVVRIHAAFQGQPAALYDVATMTVVDGALSIELSPDRTRCKAAERRACLVGGGGDVPARAETTTAQTSGGCGCASATSAPAEAACCA